MSLLHKVLDKFGVNDIKELSEQDKLVYNEWSEALKGRKLTDKEVRNFLYQLQAEVIGKLRNVSELNEKQLMFYSMQLDMVQKILSFLEMPEVEKEIIKNNLEQMI